MTRPSIRDEWSWPVAEIFRFRTNADEAFDVLAMVERLVIGFKVDPWFFHFDISDNPHGSAWDWEFQGTGVIPHDITLTLRDQTLVLGVGAANPHEAGNGVSIAEQLWPGELGLEDVIDPTDHPVMRISVASVGERDDWASFYSALGLACRSVGPPVIVHQIELLDRYFHPAHGWEE